MKNLFNRFKMKHENKGKKGKMLLGLFGGTAALAALAPAAGAAPIEFTGITTGVDVGDALQTGVNFMGIFGEWTNLAIGVFLAAVIIGFIFFVIRKIPQKGGGKK